MANFVTIFMKTDKVILKFIFMKNSYLCHVIILPIILIFFKKYFVSIWLSLFYTFLFFQMFSKYWLDIAISMILKILYICRILKIIWGLFIIMYHNFQNTKYFLMTNLCFTNFIIIWEVSERIISISHFCCRNARNRLKLLKFWNKIFIISLWFLF